VDIKDEKDESLVDAGKTAVMTMRWRLLADRTRISNHCENDVDL